MSWQGTCQRPSSTGTLGRAGTARRGRIRRSSSASAPISPSASATSTVAIAAATLRSKSAP
jgi:hypothetical protein